MPHAARVMAGLIAQLPIEHRILEAADVFYDGTADDAGSDSCFNWITLKNMFITGEGHERHEQLPGMGSFAPYQSRQLVGLGMGLFSSTSQRIRCQRARLTFYSRLHRWTRFGQPRR